MRTHPHIGLMIAQYNSYSLGISVCVKYNTLHLHFVEERLVEASVDYLSKIKEKTTDY